MAVQDELVPALERLQRALEAKSKEFWPVIKTGRTHLQDATPIRLGQEFKGYAGQIEESIRRARGAVDELSRVPLGGTAVGTGLNSHPQYARIVAARLAKASRVVVKETTNHFHAQATLDVLVAAHGALRTIGTSLWKIGSDIRLMGTGPIAGLGELRLAETQPGSSIMPGKVNPVIVESMLMVIARVYGNDTTVAVCGQAGSLFELNVMMPVAGAAILESITLLAAATRNFSERCVEGLQATDRGPELVERSPMLATALTPVIGYDEAAKLAKESMLDSFYMVIITISTVGYTEVHPQGATGRLFTSGLIVVGVGTMLYGFGVFAETLADNAFGRYRRDRQLQRDLNQLRDHFIICGYGRIGTQVVAEFEEHRVPYVVIDQTEEALERIRAEGRLHIAG